MNPQKNAEPSPAATPGTIWSGVPRLVVVGGGITGLAAAWQGVQAGAAVTVLEAGHRWGGRLDTGEVAGVRVDAGADAFLARVPEGIALCEELGVRSELVSPARRNAKVWVNGRLVTLPEGLVLGIPVDPERLSAAGVVSAEGARAVADEQQRQGEPLGAEDVSVAELITDRLGAEICEILVEPLLAGINAGMADQLSLEAVAPQVATAARRDVSLVRALREDRDAGPSDPDSPVFFAHPEGMGHLVDVLVQRLEAAGADLRLDAPVTSVERGGRTDGCWKVRWDSAGEPAGHSEAEADGVVLATPARVAAELVAGLSPRAAGTLREMGDTSVALVTFVFRPEDVPVPLDASGFLVPRTAGLLTTAVSWASAKWAHLGATGRVVLRVSAGHAGDGRIATLDDDDLVAALRAELESTMGVRAEPVGVRVTRYPDGFPQYRVGHLARVAEVEAALASAAPGLTVAGASYRGLGVPSCIRQGRAAAVGVLAVAFPGARSAEEFGSRSPAP